MEKLVHIERNQSKKNMHNRKTKRKMQNENKFNIPILVLKCMFRMEDILKMNKNLNVGMFCGGAVGCCCCHLQ